MPQRFRAASMTAFACRNKSRNRELGVTRELDGSDLPFRAALAEAAGTRIPFTFSKNGAGSSPRTLRIRSIEIDADLVGDTSVGERLDQRLIGILQAGILPTMAMSRYLRGCDALVDEPPARKVRLAFWLDAESHQHFAIEPASW